MSKYKQDLHQARKLLLEGEVQNITEPAAFLQSFV